MIELGFFDVNFDNCVKLAHHRLFDWSFSHAIIFVLEKNSYFSYARVDQAEKWH